MSTEALSNVVVVVPVIRIWSGQVTLRRDEDLNTASGLPPKTLVSDGGKRIVDPKALTTLESQRRCVNRELASLGVRSPMGYLISPDRETQVHEYMVGRKANFETSLDTLVNTYDRLCSDWEAQNPGFEGFLRRNRPSAKEVQASCSFAYATYKVAPVDSAVGQEQFAEVARSATSSLVEDVAANADAILKEIGNRDRVTQRTISVVRELVRKLRGFTMFDPRILPSAMALERVLEGLPKNGPLDTTDTLILGAMLRSMTDPNQLLNLGNSHEQVLDDEVEPELEVASSPIPTAATQAPRNAVLL